MALNESFSMARLTRVFRWPQRIQFLRGYFVIVGAFLVHLTLGTVYTYGNIAPYMVSYIRERSHPRDLRSGSAAWIYALALGGSGVSMFFGGLLEQKLGPRFSTLIGSGLMSLGVLLSYVAIKISFFLLLLTYGAMFGLGVGIAYVGPIACAMRWMPRWKGVMAGLVVSGFGLGALVFTPVQTVFINPSNRPVNSEGYFVQKDVLDRVPTVFLILGGVYVFFQLVGSLLIVDPPETREETPVPPHDGEINNTARSNEEENIRSRAERFFKSQDSLGNGSYFSNERSEGGSMTPESRPSAPEELSGSPIPSTSGDESSFSYTETEEETSQLIPADLNIQADRSAKKRSKRRSHRHRTHQRSPDRASMKELSKELSKESELEKSTSSITSQRSTTSRNIVADLSPMQMLKKLNFYHLWFMMTLAGFAVFFTATLYKFFGLTFINDDHFLAIVGSGSSICNCAGRIIWGFLADKVSYKFSLVLQSGIMSAFLLTLYATSAVGKSTYFIWICVIFFCIGGVFSLFPTAIARSFGSKYMSVNYGLLFSSQIISSVVAALLFTTVQRMLNWMGIIFLVSGFCLVGFLLTLLFRPKRYVILDFGRL